MTSLYVFESSAPLSRVSHTVLDACWSTFPTFNSKFYQKQHEVLNQFNQLVQQADEISTRTPSPPPLQRAIYGVPPSLYPYFEERVRSSPRTILDPPQTKTVNTHAQSTRHHRTSQKQTCVRTQTQSVPSREQFPPGTYDANVDEPACGSFSTAKHTRCERTSTVEHRRLDSSTISSFVLENFSAQRTYQ